MKKFLLFDKCRTYLHLTSKILYISQAIPGINVKARFENAQKHPVRMEGRVLTWQTETLPVRVGSDGREQTVSRTLMNVFRTFVKTMARVVT